MQDEPISFSTACRDILYALYIWVNYAAARRWMGSSLFLTERAAPRECRCPSLSGAPWTVSPGPTTLSRARPFKERHRQPCKPTHLRAHASRYPAAANLSLRASLKMIISAQGCAKRTKHHTPTYDSSAQPPTGSSNSVGNLEIQTHHATRTETVDFYGCS